MAIPLVSIVIPSYKPAHFEQCLRSAIGQTYPRTEILVSDNCPTEEIRDICARFPGVIYQRSTALRGANVLSCLYSGKGNFIKPLFDDDLLHPFCVERMVATMGPRPDIELVFSTSQKIDSDNMRTEIRRPYEASGTLEGIDMHRSMVLGMRNFIGEFSTIMFRRETLWAIPWQKLFMVGEHDCSNGLADLAAYINLVGGNRAFFIEEELSYFRFDPRMQSNSNPAANPLFGYCFSDYIDLLSASHRMGVISTPELQASASRVQDVIILCGAYFEQVGEASARYHAYCAALPQELAHGA